MIKRTKKSETFLRLAFHLSKEGDIIIKSVKRPSIDKSIMDYKWKGDIYTVKKTQKGEGNNISESVIVHKNNILLDSKEIRKIFEKLGLKY